MRYAVVTFGCRVNQADSLAVEAGLTGAGGVAGVARSRRRRPRQHLLGDGQRRPGRPPDDPPDPPRESRGADRRHRLLRVALSRDEVAALPGVAQVVPQRRQAEAADDAAAGRRGRRRGTADGPCGRMPGPGLMGRTAWTLRAQTGCNEPCSYCIIPTTRGTSRSRPLADVLDELRRVVAAGYREVALTGVHLGAWGRDLGDGSSLEGLLAGMASVPGDFRVRVSSLEPMDCTAGGPRLARRSPRSLHAALAPAAAARVGQDPAGDAPAVLVGRLRPARGRRPRPAAARGDRLGRHRRLPRRDRGRRRGARRLPRRVAAHTPPRVPVFRSAGHGRFGAVRQGARRAGEGSRSAAADHLSGAVRPVPRGAGRHDAGRR